MIERAAHTHTSMKSERNKTNNAEKIVNKTKQNTYDGTLLSCNNFKYEKESAREKVANSVIKRIKVFFFSLENGKSEEDKQEREKNKQKIY